MLNSLLTRVFGSRNDRLLRQLQTIVAKINALEPEMEKLSDAELQAKTAEFQQRIADGEIARQAAAGSVRGLPRGLAGACSACATTTCS